MNGTPVPPIDEWTSAVHDPTTLYRLAKQIDGYPGEGSWLLCVARVSAFFGLRRRQFFYEPLQNYDSILAAVQYEGRQRDCFIREHIVDHVAVSFQIFESAYSAPMGRLSCPQPGERSLGGHAVALVGYDDFGESLVFRNSWGARWGDGGHGTVSRQYLDRYLIDGWRSSNARYGATRHTWAGLTSSQDDRAWRSAFLLENPRWRYPVRYAGHEYTLVNYEALSVNDGCPVEILELRNRSGVRVAWVELFHQPSSNGTATTLVKEMFVWPPWRRRGYGSIVEAAATIRSAAWQSSMMHVPFYEPDAQVGPIRMAGRTFAQHRGYVWHWKPGTRPTTAGYATKQVDVEAAYRILKPWRRGYQASTSCATPSGVRPR